MYDCDICRAELRTKQGLAGHKRFRHQIGSGSKRGGNIFSAKDGKVYEVDSGEEGTTKANAQHLAVMQQIIACSERIELWMIKCQKQRIV